MFNNYLDHDTALMTIYTAGFPTEATTNVYQITIRASFRDYLGDLGAVEVISRTVSEQYSYSTGSTVLHCDKGILIDDIYDSDQIDDLLENVKNTVMKCFVESKLSDDIRSKIIEICEGFVDSVGSILMSHNI